MTKAVTVAPEPGPSRTAMCTHCGQPVPAGLVRTADAEQFCCTGCRQVYTLVREWGFGQFYRLVDQQQGGLEPARVSGRSFDDFDDPQLQATATDVLGPERRRTRLYLEGVHCAACVWLVEKLPAVLSGVDDVRLNYGSAVAEVTWRPGRTRLSTIGRALDRLGYTPHVHQAARLQDARRSEDRAALARFGVAVACAMNLMFLSGALYAGAAQGMASPFEQFFRWMSLLVAVPVLTFSARPFFRTAAAGLRAGVVHIDLPIAVALAIAFLASASNVTIGRGPIWFDSLAMLVAALLGARQLQRSAQRAAIERADSLRGVAFLEFARRLDGDGADAPSVEVPLTALAPGDRVEVRSGELVPVDGVVLAGESSLDNAIITGESVAVPVRTGDPVHAGATNLGARLLVRVAAAGAGTRVGALLAVVQEALSRKPALLETTDALARRFVQTLLVVGLATLAFGWWRHGPDVALTRVVALLVVSCPCALGLSVPLAMSVSIMRAARAGIFIKNPDAIARLQQVRTIVLDKTGTVTEGHASVVRWHGSAVALRLARTLEAQSSHRVARAFQHTGELARRSASARPPLHPLHLVPHVADVMEVPGFGISGRLDGHEVHVGSWKYLAAVGATRRANDGPHLAGADLPSAAAIDSTARTLLDDGLSPVFVAVDRRPAGVAGIGDRLRPDARRTVQRLRDRGVHVCLASGDHPAVVSRIGVELGLPDEDVHGGLTPEAKRDFVAGLVSARPDGGAIVMVGDGVNDAAALALADVGIAVQGGMGATMVAADIVLTRDGVRPLLDILDGARRLRGVVRRNIAFSLLYNAGASSLALAGLVGPLLAAVLMPLSSLTVVLSSSLSPTFATPSGRPATRSTRDPLGA